jgi:predicted transposase/invertase (TIGR01784 family)
MSSSPPPQASFLDPKLDVVFKALFGREQSAPLLVGLLNAMLELPEAERIESVQLLSPLLERESIEEKLAVLDVSVKDVRGRRYAVEMQCRSHPEFTERMLYYATRRYSEQLGQAEEYASLRPLVLVVITDFVLIPELEGWLERFELRARSRPDVLFSPHLSVVLAQLPKLRKSASEAQAPAEQWAVFLKEGTKMATETKDRPWLTPELRQAIEELERLEGDPKMRALYEARQREVRLQATLLRASYEEGREEGREEGSAQATRALARRLLQEGEPPERVARLTGLPPADLRSL